MMIDRLLVERMREIMLQSELSPDMVDEVVDALVEATLPYDELLHEAWQIIANVGGGDWKKQPPEWQYTAHRFGVRAGYRRE